MHSSDNPQAFQNALYDPSPPRSRPTLGVAASIWAPQPQPSEATWPKTLDSFSRVAEREFDARSNGNGNRPETNGAAVVRREDVFGPAAPPAPPASGAPRPKDIGAIGDGRKKNSPGFDDTHVEQLLRTLNLNSPAPYAKKQPPPTLCLDTSPSSPDCSPASATSSLMTPTDSPSTRSFDPKFMHSPSYDLAHTLPSYLQPQSSLLFEHAGNSPGRVQDGFISSYRSTPTHQSYPPSAPAASHTHANAGVNNFPFFEPFAETMPASYSHSHHHHPLNSNNHTQSIPRSLPVYNTNMNHSPPTSLRRIDSGAAPRTLPPMDWRLASGAGDWLLPTDDKFDYMHSSGAVGRDEPPPGPTLHNSFMYQSQPQQLSSTPMHSHEPINFLSLLHPSSSPPYHVFVERIIKSSDQQASIFLQQKLKVADLEERAKIVDAICARGFEMMAHRFGNWAVQRLSLIHI
ncbi:Meiotic coiled-coil protein 2 [Hypsizygus marmoreus]|uniref:Meiotic coiled-coil protein 2 n=1 Tax=Hypsizygus marmoreus TaxID=39966 RepID=A0A369J0Z8_HYPMA|nr:Meiotic coiled-coil protein 2 [Hypsizygus marmoreus]